MLRTIKTVHTLVWAVMAAASLYILYCGIAGRFDIILYLSLLLLGLETIVLLFNRWTCPLTPLARRYTDAKADNFDIYIPEWLARHNKLIFGTIFIVGVILVAINWIRL